MPTLACRSCVRFARPDVDIDVRYDDRLMFLNREKEVHDKHLRQLEEEMEQQMQKVEERVRKQVGTRVTSFSC